MKKTFLIVFESAISQAQLSAFFDSLPNRDIFWFFNMPNSMFVTADESAKSLFEKLDNHFGQQYKLFVTEIKSDYYGRLPSEHWNYFTTKSLLNS